jgi:hypothetical protein
MGLTADTYEKHRTTMAEVLEYSTEAEEDQEKLNAKGMIVIESEIF